MYEGVVTCRYAMLQHAGMQPGTYVTRYAMLQVCWYLCPYVRNVDAVSAGI